MSSFIFSSLPPKRFCFRYSRKPRVSWDWKAKASNQERRKRSNFSRPAACSSMRRKSAPFS
ncbi:hypothetical protein D3C83_307410 [compost metagenome]